MSFVCLLNFGFACIYHILKMWYEIRVSEESVGWSFWNAFWRSMFIEVLIVVDMKNTIFLMSVNFYQRRWNHISVGSILYPYWCTSQLSWKCILLEFVTWLQNVITAVQTSLLSVNNKEMYLTLHMSSQQCRILYSLV